MNKNKTWKEKAAESPSFRYTYACWMRAFWEVVSWGGQWLADQASKPAWRASARVDRVICDAMDAAKHPDDTHDLVHCPRCGTVLLQREFSYIEETNTTITKIVVDEPIFPFGLGSEQLCRHCYDIATNGVAADDFCMKCYSRSKASDSSPVCRQSHKPISETDTATSVGCDRFIRMKPRKMA